VEDLREAAIVKSLSKRSKIALCVHGINKAYCTYCAKAPAKKSKKKAADAAPADAAPEAPPAENATT
jgi:hypothetical protein